MVSEIMRAHSDPTISIIVVTREERKFVFPRALKEQRFGKPFEVIVVQGGSRGHARNLAITQSKTPLVAFIDDDCEAETGWLSSLVASLPEDATVAGVGGVSSGRNSGSSLQRAIDGIFSTFIGSLNSPSLVSLTSRRRSFVRALSGHNCIFRRNSLIEVGGFDARFELNEDTDICARLRERSYNLILDQGIFVHHRRRSSWGNFARQFFWYGVGRMRSMLTGRRYVDTRILVLFLAAVSVASLAPIAPLLFLAMVSGYFLLILGSSVLGAMRIRSFGLAPRMIVLFAIEHFSYLLGLLWGIFLGSWKKGSGPRNMRITRYLVESNSVIEISDREILESANLD